MLSQPNTIPMSLISTAINAWIIFKYFYIHDKRLIFYPSCSPPTPASIRPWPVPHPFTLKSDQDEKLIMNLPLDGASLRWNATCHVNYTVGITQSQHHIVLGRGVYWHAGVYIVIQGCMIVKFAWEYSPLTVLTALRRLNAYTISTAD